MEELNENNSDGYLTDLEYAKYVNLWEDLLVTDETVWQFSESEWERVSSTYANESYLVEKIIRGLQQHDLTSTVILTGLVAIVSWSTLILGVDRALEKDFIFGLVTIPILLTCAYLAIMYSYLLFTMCERISTAKSLIRRHQQ